MVLWRMKDNDSGQIPHANGIRKFYAQTSKSVDILFANGLEQQDVNSRSG